MSELSGLYALWEREFRIFLRERSRIVSSAINPLLWLFVFGGGLGSQVSVGNLNYQTFIYPGVVVMTVLFSSIFYGAYVVWDKRLDFLKEVLVAPISRVTIFLGKVLGGVTDGLIQATILLLFAPIFGITYGLNLTLVYAFLFILVIGLVSVGLVIGSMMESPEGFGLIISFVNFPLFFLSGALYPLSNLPTWLTIFTAANPVSYGVDAIRALMLGTHTFGIFVDFVVLLMFALLMIAIGSLAFKRMKL
ncbi:MAG: ABC transporter permease [Thaumarchaeota archaeon]|nr:ABC transporter permease [Nitrososphaerota archaeon]